MKKMCLPILAVALILAIAAALTVGSKSFDSGILWSYHAPRETLWTIAGTASTPVIAGDTIVYQSGYPSHDQVYLRVIDRKSGKQIWSTIDPVQQFEVYDGLVYVLSRPDFFASEPARIRSGWLFAFSLKTGEEVWRMPTQNNSEVRILSVGKLLLCNAAKNAILAIDSKTGKTVWRRHQSTLDPSGKSMVVSNGTIFSEQPNRSIAIMDGSSHVTEYSVKRLRNEGKRSLVAQDNHLLVLDSNGYMFSADVKKKTSKGPFVTGEITSKVAIKDDVAYFAFNEPTAGKSDESATKSDQSTSRKDSDVVSKNSNFCAFDLNTGRPLWTIRLPGSTTSAPVLLDNNVLCFCVNNENLVYALDRISGTVLWKTAVDAPSAGVTSSDGILYVNAGRGLVALDQKKGSKLWSAEVAEQSASGNPVVCDNVVYMAANDSNLYAIKPKRVEMSDTSPHVD